MAKNQDARSLNEQKKKETEFKVKDRIYNWIVDRYSKHNNEFNFSDEFIWQGAIYTIPEIFGYILFFAVFYWLGGHIYDKYGYARLFMFFMLLAIWRLNVMVKLLRKISKDGVALGQKTKGK